jgi:hypothetical protein
MGRFARVRKAALKRRSPDASRNPTTATKNMILKTRPNFHLHRHGSLLKFRSRFLPPFAAVFV